VPEDNYTFYCIFQALFVEKASNALNRNVFMPTKRMFIRDQLIALLRRESADLTNLNATMAT